MPTRNFLARGYVQVKAVVDVLLLVCVSLSALTVSLADIFDVTHYGAVGDGKTDDTRAFLKAWGAICGSGGGRPTLTVPSNKLFFLNPLTFMGPCKSSAIKVQIDGTLVAPNSRGAWKNCASNSWVVFHNVFGLQIGGTGTLDAKGSAWWSAHAAYDEENNVTNVDGGECSRPTTFRLINCNSAQLSGLNFVNSGGNHISINNCKSLDVRKINIKAPESSPNTDGIDLFDSSHVMISDSFIATGDDCIAIKNRCFHVNISDITCGPGHGISVGSLGNDGSSVAVEGVYVQHCTFIRTQASARIKTWQGGSGYARNIYYYHLTLNSVKSAIEIDQHYTSQDKSKNAVQVSEVHFTNVQGSGEKIKLECSPDVPCDNIVVEQVKVTSSSPGKQVEVTCRNAKVDSSAVTPTLPC